MLLVAIVLCSSAYYTAANFAIITDTGELISSRVRWRQLETALIGHFRIALTLVVIDAPTPEIATGSAGSQARCARLTARMPARFRAQWPVVFAEEVSFADRQPPSDRTTVSGVIGADPSLRGLTHIFALMATAVRDGHTAFDAINQPIKINSLPMPSRASPPVTRWHLLGAIC